MSAYGRISKTTERGDVDIVLMGSHKTEISQK